jgi:hypothetical protein
VTTLANSGAGSLRQAILDANATPGDDTITFAVTGTINLSSALPHVSSNIDIQGPGARALTVRSVGGGTPAFQINSGATVSLSNLTITNGNSGVFNFGNSTIGSCNITFNAIGIANYGTLTLENSSISDNHSGATAGIYNEGAALTISNSTISRNSADDVEIGDCAAISSQQPITINNSTVSANSSANGGVGGICGQLVYARNTIVAGNTPFDFNGFEVVGNNNFLGGDPRLAPLQNNGGPTDTMAPLPGSPVLNAGDPDQLGVADQRGVVRSGGVNIGAYQASATAFALTAPATVQAGTPFGVTVKAVDPFMQTAVGYTGTAHFTSSDPQTVAQDLPGDYTFTGSDAGMHTFSNAVTLKTAGSQAVTATDTVTGSLSGSASVLVTPAAADHLLFLQQPADTAAGQTITPAVMVAVVDQYGNVLTDDNSDTVTLTIGTNPSGGTLSGTLTVTVSGGIATFSDLAIDLTGDGYTLHAVTTGLADADSAAFHITA